MTTRNRWLWFLGALLLLPLAVFCQTNGVPPVPAVPVTDLPKNVAQYWDLGIAFLTPFLVTVIYKTVPKIPKWVLPAITPALGIGLGMLVNWATTADLGWMDMAKAGALAVFVREVVNQAITKRYASDAATAAAPPS